MATIPPPPTPTLAPALHDGQWVTVNKLVYRFRPPARAGSVCIWTGTEYMTKRIIGLPREEVAVHAGKLQVNGTMYLEPYVGDPGDLEILPCKIPANSFVVIADRRSGTIVAVVNRRRIVGKVVCGKAPDVGNPSVSAGQTVEERHS